jgi:mono/diheme cytochrome c family protein
VAGQAADDPSLYRGAAIAGQVCAQCHDTSGGRDAKPGFSAVSFGSVANRPDMTVAKLEHWLTSSHPSMPNYLFDSTTVDDLAAYIMSLRRPS